MKDQALSFIAALQFLTLLPPVIRRAFTPAEMGHAVGYYPLVGILIGFALFGSDYLLSRLFPLPVTAALLLVLWVLLSGALHVDGFLDACDGLLGGATPEQRMQIMRDERIGAFAFTAGTLLFLTKFAVLATLSSRLPALILAPVLGRWAISTALVVFPYARAEGLGAGIKAHATWRQAMLATVTALAAAWFLAGWHGLSALLLVLVVMLGTARFTLRRIPGLTGDIYGLLNELVEISVLLAFATTI